MHRPHVNQQQRGGGAGTQASKTAASQIKAASSKPPAPGQFGQNRAVHKREQPYTSVAAPEQAATSDNVGVKAPAQSLGHLPICYVLDTNVIVDDPRAFLAFAEHDVVIPLVVCEELDNLKTRIPEVREANRLLYALRLSEKWTKLASGGRIKIDSGLNLKGLPVASLEHKNDNLIISTAFDIDRAQGPKCDDPKYRAVVLVTNDLAVGIKSWALGLESEVYKTKEVSNLIGGEDDVLPKLVVTNKDLEVMGAYRGNHAVLSVSAGLRKKIDKMGIPQNSGVLVCLEGEDGPCIQFAAVYRDKSLVRVDAVNSRVWNNGVIKPYVPAYWKGIIEGNHEQEVYLNALYDHETTLVCGYGRAGTGKTLMAVAAGLQMVLNGDYDKILITKPQVASGQDIGFLPGKKEDKMASWIAPMRDHILSVLKKLKKRNRGGDENSQEGTAEKPNPWEGKQQSQRKTVKRGTAKPDAPTQAKGGTPRPVSDKEIFDELIASGILEVEATAFVRGRSLERTFVVIDEGQNLSVEQMKTWVTRIGEGSKLVVTGDIEQIDSPYLRKNYNGLAVLAERSKGEPWAFSVHLVYGVRSVMSDWAANNL